MSSRSAQGKDSTNVLAFNDSISNAGAVIDPLHRRVHLGDLRTVSLINSVASLGTIGIRIRPSEDAHVRIWASMGGLADGRIEVFESAVFSSTGTDSAGELHNRTSVKTNQVVVATNAVFTSGGTIFDAIVTPGTRHESLEWILKKDTEYYVRLTNFGGSAAFASLNVIYYS